MNPNNPLPPQPPALLSPTELVTMIAHRKNKKSDFSLTVWVDGFNPILKAGERFSVGAAAQKAGYLYLFHVEPNGDFRLIFPMPGQSNVVPANEKVKVGAADNKAGVAFTADGATGTHRILAFVTTRPLRFSNAHPVPHRQDGGQKAEFRLNPTTEEVVRGLLVDAVGEKARPQMVEQETGVDVEQLPFEFAMAEAIFRVEPGAKPEQKK